VDGDADRMVSVSADQSIRIWQISTYAELTAEMKKIREVFQQKPGPPSVLKLRPNSEFRVSRVSDVKQDAVSGGDRSAFHRLADYTPTAGPAPQPPATNVPVRITQGHAVYSARFSPDGRRMRSTVSPGRKS
jgi:hypothetical protein